MSLRTHAPADLHRLAATTFEAAGWCASDAGETAEHLVLANLCGHDSHGIGMLPHYMNAHAEGLLRPEAKPETKIDAAPFLVIDAHVALGQPTANAATRRACTMAKEGGVAIVNLVNAHHIGRIGHYAEMAAAQGLVSMFWVNVAGRPPIVAPHGSREARWGTNPHAMGVPCRDNSGNDAPLILDFATSRIAHGKARVALNKGVPVPDGCLIDHEGRASTDPACLFDEPLGALLPFGEHKGAGIALIAEILSAGLSNGPTMPEAPRKSWIINSLFSIIIDPARLSPDDAGQNARTAMLADFVRSAAPREGTDKVRAPGDIERETRLVRARNGIPVDDETWRLVCEAAARVGVQAR